MLKRKHTWMNEWMNEWMNLILINQIIVAEKITITYNILIFVHMWKELQLHWRGGGTGLLLLIIFIHWHLGAVGV